MPRWLTEGLADLEPTLERAEWKRENDFDIYKALQAGRLKGIASMYTAFTRARSIQEMVVAYYQGSLMVGYLIKSWGAAQGPAGAAGLRPGARHRADPARGHRGALSNSSTTASARAELARLAHYNRSWYLDLERYEDFKRLRGRREEEAQRRQAPQADLAVALLVRREVQAGEQAGGADPRPPEQEQAGALRRGPGGAGAAGQPRAEQLFKRLLNAGGDGYDVRGWPWGAWRWSGAT